MRQFYFSFYWLTSVLGLFFCAVLPAAATHIVGGELQLQQLNGPSSATYRVSLNLYFDEVNGQQGAKDPSVQVFIFRKSDNVLMGGLSLPQTGSSAVPYTNPSCSVASLQTTLIQYSQDVTFNTSLLNDPRGYYMVWERCCRNNAINNIVNPGSAGSEFYLEFPAMRTTSGAPFANSSPVFNPIKGDYICINQPFSFDFGATDADGDSLVYTLVTPYNGYSTDRSPSPAVATPSSAYPEVRWASGFNQNSAIPGPVPLQVNPKTGQLSVTAGQIGLFVFCVQVEEYRKGANGVRQRIGLVRRDFQLKVIDCKQNNPPSMAMRPAGQQAFYQAGTVLKLSATDPRCLDLYITDGDANQQIQLAMLDNSVSGFTFAPSSVTTRFANDTIRTQICFDRCVGADGKPVTLALLAKDNGCPAGLQDTLKIQVQIEPDPNQKPSVGTDLPDNRATVQSGQRLQFNVTGTDLDPDLITLRAVGRGFSLAAAGMRFDSASGTGTVKQSFQWTPQCTQIRDSVYTIDFIVADSRCSRQQYDTVTVQIRALPSANQAPSVRTTLPQAIVELTVMPTDSLPNSVRFDAIAEDAEPQVLQLSAVGKGFDWKAMGMQFENKTGLGPLTSPFSWQPGCAVLQGKEKETFELDFIAQDSSCPNGYDTTRVTLIVRDVPARYDITIPNVFTPNGDGKNDFFTIPDLPADNCVEQFRKVDIVNRWGKSVYSSTDRHFRWDGSNVASGQYYYLIQYTQRSYKGWVTLLR